MKSKSLKKLGLILVLAGGILVNPSCKKDNPNPDAIVQDTFQKNASGWTIYGDAQGGYVEPQYSPNGGVSGGYIYAKDDVAGWVWYFKASKSYEGNQSEFYGATLSFSLFQDADIHEQFSYADIVFEGAGKNLFYPYDNKSKYPGKDWTNYSIKIATNNGWYVGTYKTKYNGSTKDYHPATEGEMKEILSDVTSFMIRGEFEVGKDKGGLDEVKIK